VYDVSSKSIIKPVGMLRDPRPRVPAHIIDGQLCLPSKHFFSFSGDCKELSNVPLAASN